MVMAIDAGLCSVKDDRMTTQSNTQTNRQTPARVGARANKDI